jgi:hypothetical protein
LRKLILANRSNSSRWGRSISVDTTAENYAANTQLCFRARCTDND